MKRCLLFLKVRPNDSKLEDPFYPGLNAGVSEFTLLLTDFLRIYPICLTH